MGVKQLFFSKKDNFSAFLLFFSILSFIFAKEFEDYPFLYINISLN